MKNFMFTKLWWSWRSQGRYEQLGFIFFIPWSPLIVIFDILMMSKSTVKRKQQEKK